jgi:hypothetical protein
MRVHLHCVGAVRAVLALRPLALRPLALRPPVRALRERRPLVSGLGQRARLPRVLLVLGWRLVAPGEWLLREAAVAALGLPGVCPQPD